MGKEQEGDYERRDRNELEEPAPGILRIRQRRRRLDPIGAAEQIAKLDANERQEERVDEPEDHTNLDKFEAKPTYPRRFRHRFAFSKERAPQVAPCQPGEQRPQHQVFKRLLWT